MLRDSGHSRRISRRPILAHSANLRFNSVLLLTIAVEMREGISMTSTKLTSTGHALADASWLDTHFQSARPEYEEALRYVGVKPGWKVLDAGCGGGGFLPLMSELVGPSGSVTAMDLAPENVAHVEALVRDGKLPATVQARVGSLLKLPFEDSTFDCVWSANVVQYLKEDEFLVAMQEFKRVLKPRGLLALKDFDNSMVQFVPMDPGVTARFFVERRADFARTGQLGAACGTSLASRLRRAGLTEIRRRGWLIERWAPVEPATRTLVEACLKLWSGQAAGYGVSASDLRIWQEAVANPTGLIDNPDFCWREFFVLAVGRVTKP
ncbi:MAG: class I SAM-dependent methyltransferase [Hyphomicrobiaceae bacterium]